MNIIEIYKRFPTEEDCIKYLEFVRWNYEPKCTYCQSKNVTTLSKENRHHCNNCNTSFSVTVGTIFHHTHLPLQKWFLAITLILNAKKGIAARQLARDLEVNKNTAWYLGMRIRKAMLQSDERKILTGIVEMDECFIGGKLRKGSGGNNSENGNNGNKRDRGTKKTPVVGMIQRGGNVVARVSKKDLKGKTLSALVRENVDIENVVLITDEYCGYLGIKRFLKHEVVNHQVWYVDGYKHTNTIDRFWVLLKRGIVGQYHKVILNYLPKYVDEFCYRINHRENADLFGLTLRRGLRVEK